jgi:hypothetical protein
VTEWILRERLRRTKAWGELLSLGADEARLSRLCWLARCGAQRARMRGAKARRALRHVEGLFEELGEEVDWLLPSIAPAFEPAALTWWSSELRDLGEPKPPVERGRPRRTAESIFLRAIGQLIPKALQESGRDRKGRRLIESTSRASDGTLNALVADLYPIVFESHLANDSIRRTRQRSK